MSEEQDQNQTTEDWSQPIEEYSSDAFWIALNPWSATLTFGLPQASPNENDVAKIKIHIPLQQAKALALTLSRAIRRYEIDTNVPLELPDDLLDGFGIAPDEWKRFTKEDQQNQ